MVTDESIVDGTSGGAAASGAPAAGTVGCGADRGASNQPSSAASSHDDGASSAGYGSPGSADCR
jgi:hypothetical protein